MAIPDVKKYAQAYRFTVVPGPWERARDTVVRLGGFDHLPVMPLLRITSEPGQRCILERGICLDEDEPDLSQLMTAARGHMVVFLLGRDNRPVKAFALQWTEEEWLPLALDAEHDGVACERMLLRGCTYKELEQWR